MPGAFALCALFVAIFTLAFPAHTRDILVTIDNENIKYSEGFSDNSECTVDLTFDTDCDSQWFFFDSNSNINNGTQINTWGPNASMTFEFQGASLEIIAEQFPGGGAFFATVDDVQLQEGYLMDGDDEFHQFVIGADLDPSISHTAVISYDVDLFSADPDARVFISINAFVVRGAPETGTVGSTVDFIDSDSTESATNGTSRAGSDTANKPTTTNAQAFQLPKTPNKPLSIAAIGGLIGIILFAILLAVVAFLIYRRRQRRFRSRTQAPSSYMFGPDAKAMQEANVGMGAPGALVQSPDAGASLASQSEAQTPRRPEARGSPLYTTYPKNARPFETLVTPVREPVTTARTASRSNDGQMY